jgi:hypothetical protein
MVMVVGEGDAANGASGQPSADPPLDAQDYAEWRALLRGEQESLSETPAAFPAAAPAASPPPAATDPSAPPETGVAAAVPPVVAAAPAPPPAASAALQTTTIQAGAGDLTINLELDSNASLAPSSYINGWKSAAEILSATIRDPITVNLEIGYTENPGDGSSDDPGVASAEPAYFETDTYSQVLNLLVSNGAPAVIAAVDALPNTSSLNGRTDFSISSAEAKVWGQVSPTDPAIDGFAGFGTGIPSNDIVGVAMHELTHAMGRVQGDASNNPTSLALFRYTSPGQHDFFGDDLNLGPSYFSIDDGNSHLADFGRNDDAGDFLNPPYSSLTPHDPFDELYDAQTQQSLTSVDTTMLDMLGFSSIVPVVHVQNVSVSRNAAIPAATMITGISNPLGDNLTTYEFFDEGGAGGHFVVNGAAQPDNQPISVPIGSLGGVQYVGGPARGSETLAVAVFDATTGSYSNYSYLVAATVTTSAPDDFNGDGISDVLWRDNASGDTGYWAISAGAATWQGLGGSPTSYNIVGVGGFTGGGIADVLWRDNTSGDTGYWAISGGAATWQDLGGSPTDYSVVGVGDFTGNGIADVLWRDNASGDTGYWAVSGGAAAWQGLGGSPTDYSVVGVGDFTGNGIADVLWRDNASGDTGYWAVPQPGRGWVARRPTTASSGLAILPVTASRTCCGATTPAAIPAIGRSAAAPRRGRAWAGRRPATTSSGSAITTATASRTCCGVTTPAATRVSGRSAAGPRPGRGWAARRSATRFRAAATRRVPARRNRPVRRSASPTSLLLPPPTSLWARRPPPRPLLSAAPVRSSRCPARSRSRLATCLIDI